MTTISSLRSFTLDLPPSCIAFCPSQPEHFVVGTYFLHPKESQDHPTNTSAGVPENVQVEQSDSETVGDQSPQRRTGSLILFRLDGETITQIVTKHIDSAVLDIQWTPHNLHDGNLLAVATSTGLITIYRLDLESRSADLTFLTRKVVADPTILVLSIAWQPYQPHVIGFTLSDGNVCLLHDSAGISSIESEVMQVRAIHKHELEAWILAFAGDELNDVLSGGDDVVLQNSSITDGTASFKWKDRKLHEAGVTAILPLTNDLIITGSYDDYIRLISTPAAGRRQVLASLNLGGGVWRMKYLDSRTRIPTAESTKQAPERPPEVESAVILASCMHAGSRVVRLCKGRDGGWAFHVIAKFEEHQSMNYGSDVQPGNSDLKSIISTSFYDKLLCLWQFDMNSVESVGEIAQIYM